MSKQARQYWGLLSAIFFYYLIHEGAHLVYALIKGVFKQIRFLGLGVQIDIHAHLLSPSQLGIFCLLGSVATALFAYVLIALSGRICRMPSRVCKACAYYITIAMLLLDPLYLSLLCGFFGGGDMNGISLLIPELPARILYGILLLIHALLFVKILLPRYKAAFQN